MIGCSWELFSCTVRTDLCSFTSSVLQIFFLPSHCSEYVVWYSLGKNASTEMLLRVNSTRFWEMVKFMTLILRVPWHHLYDAGMIWKRIRTTTIRFCIQTKPVRKRYGAIINEKGKSNQHQTKTELYWHCVNTNNTEVRKTLENLHIHRTSGIWKTLTHSEGGGGGGGLECNMTGRYPFFMTRHNLFGKKVAFQYPVSE